MNKQAFLILVNKVINGTATEDELTVYNQYYNYFQQLQNDEWEEEKPGNQDETERLLLQRINHSIGFKKAPVKVLPMYRRNWIRAASVILVIIISAALLLLPKNKKSTKEITRTYNNSLPKQNLLPGGNKATLTLANGSTVILDNAINGTIAKQENTKIVKLSSGQLAYESSSEKAVPLNTVAMNILSTPEGGQYQLKLPDGSMVWLNSGSSLRFPAFFTGDERKVELTGEAYFEVAKNAAKPFKVKVKNMEVKVLGTHFNIMGYDNETFIKTTLIEGAVKVTIPNYSASLIPGQQSQVSNKGQLTVSKDIDVNEAIAWKNGLFYFEGRDIKAVMRELARWYNLDVEYQGEVNKHFSGKILRNVEASKVFKMLELTGEVHFKVQANKVIVSP